MQVRWSAALLVVVLCGIPLASAQEEGGHLPPPGEAVKPFDGLGEMPAQDVTSPEGSQAQRPPSFPKMVLLDLRHVTLSPFHWQRRDWLLFAGSTVAVTGLSAADKTLSDRARERNVTLGFVGDTFEGLGDGRSFVLLAASISRG